MPAPMETITMMDVQPMNTPSTVSGMGMPTLPFRMG